MRKPVERTEDKKLNLRLRQRGAIGLLRIVNKSTSFLSHIRSKIGSHLSLENSLQMEQSSRTFFEGGETRQ